ncbi:hypothetical protein, partial [Microvirga aerophila]|uniref:hypothetical protein n=1 Tax=Microvirga aerophila TaxID=670291 RepID=UPI0014796E39
EELERFLCGYGVQEAKLDAETGEFEVTFEPHPSRRPGLSRRFSPIEFDSSDIYDRATRASVGNRVDVVWDIMCEDFKAAIRERRCLLFARAERLSSPFTLVAPDVFDQLDEIDWAKGEGRGPVGERFYSLHAAPPDHLTEIAASDQAHAPKPGTLEKEVYDYLKRNYPGGKPLGLSYEALKAELAERAKVNASEATVRQTSQKYLGWPRKA